MPRMPRSYIKTSFFHILVQGHNKGYIFNNEVDIRKYIELIEKYQKENNIKIVAYCIMNNHAHLLLNTEIIANLSNYMHKVNGVYGTYYAKKYKHTGYVFRDRYKSEGIYSEENLYNCINYIHNNPVKAGICRNSIDYEFSTAKKIAVDFECDDNEIFLETEEDKEQYKLEIIQEFFRLENITKAELIKNKQKLRQLLVTLKIENGMSYREVEKILEISRETLRKVLK